MPDFREEFRDGFREGLDGDGPGEELRRLGTWARRLPGALARGLGLQARGLWRAAVAFLRDALRGTPVLVRLVFRALAAALRAAVRASTTTPAAALAPAAKAAEEGEESAEETAEQVETGLAQKAPARPPWRRGRPSTAKASPKAPATAPAAKGGSIGELAERFVIGLLVAVLAVTFGGMLLGYLGGLLAPYAGGIALGSAAAWCIAAACVAPREDGEPAEEEPAVEEPAEGDPTENDHEKSAGEQAEETDQWPAQREVIRNTVAALAAAGNAGHRRAKGKGVPVDDLLAEFWPHGAPEGVDRKAIIDLLERVGITVRPQMHFVIGGKKKTPPGVHVDDLANDLGYRPRLPAPLVPDLTPAPGPSREVQSAG
ncbi:hypothetical protein [Streptomyces collinus]